MNKTQKTARSNTLDVRCYIKNKAKNMIKIRDGAKMLI